MTVGQLRTHLEAYCQDAELFEIILGLEHPPETIRDNARHCYVAIPFVVNGRAVILFVEEPENF